ncbi:MAG: zinc-dependent metalloprotease family protein [Persicimonas sp.]
MVSKPRLFVVCITLFLLVGGLVSGCGEVDNTEIETVYDPCQRLALAPTSELSDDERQSLERAADMWREAAGLDLRVVDESVDEEAGEDDDPNIAIHFKTGPGMIHGYYEDASGQVVINSELTGERAREVTIAHELGHAFGLHHVERSSRRSLMNKGNLETGITDSDVALLHDRWDQCSEGSTES